MSRPGPNPKKQVSTKWSQNLAYAIGLIASDGCLSKDGRHIEFTSKDIQLSKTFKKCLGLKHIKIGFKNSSYNKKKLYSRIQFGDVNFYNFLLSIGLTPAKSKTLGKLEIPKKYFPDFLRGNFDGDGSFYSYWDNRWASSFLFYISFNSASIDYIRWLRENMLELMGIQGHSYNKSYGSRAYQLKYAKKEAYVVIKSIYHSPHLPRLERKFEKISKALKIDATNSYARVL